MLNLWPFGTSSITDTYQQQNGDPWMISPTHQLPLLIGSSVTLLAAPPRIRMSLENNIRRHAITRLKPANTSIASPIVSPTGTQQHSSLRNRRPSGELRVVVDAVDGPSLHTRETWLVDQISQHVSAGVFATSRHHASVSEGESERSAERCDVCIIALPTHPDQFSVPLLVDVLRDLHGLL